MSVCRSRRAGRRPENAGRDLSIVSDRQSLHPKREDLSSLHRRAAHSLKRIVQTEPPPGLHLSASSDNPRRPSPDLSRALNCRHAGQGGDWQARQDGAVVWHRLHVMASRAVLCLVDDAGRSFPCDRGQRGWTLQLRFDTGNLLGWAKIGDNLVIMLRWTLLVLADDPDEAVGALLQAHRASWGLVKFRSRLLVCACAFSAGPKLKVVRRT